MFNMVGTADADLQSSVTDLPWFAVAFRHFDHARIVHIAAAAGELRCGRLAGLNGAQLRELAGMSSDVATREAGRCAPASAVTMKKRAARGTSSGPSGGGQK